MTNVAEHHAKEEREGDGREDRGIRFFVCGDAVRVCNNLENIREIIRIKVCRRTDLCEGYLLKLYVYNLVSLAEKLLLLAPLTHLLLITRGRTRERLPLICSDHGLQLKLLSRAPNIACQNISICLKHVKAFIYASLFHDQELKHLDVRYFFVAVHRSVEASWNLQSCFQILPELS